MEREASVLFFVVLLTISFVSAQEKIPVNYQTSENLTIPSFFSNVTSYLGYDYLENNLSIKLEIISFDSDNSLKFNLNKSLEAVDLRRINNIDEKDYIVYSRSVEWISGNSMFHVEAENIENLIQSDFFKNVTDNNPSRLNDIIPKTIEKSFSKANTFTVQSTSACDECGAGLLNVCDQTECWSLATTCWLHGINSCSDGALLSNGHDDYCTYKDQRWGGCLRNEYDCDSNSECASGLYCVGSILGEDGCCNAGETWNGNAHICKLVEEYKTNQTFSYGNIKYGLYHGDWNQGAICVTCPAYVWSPDEIDYTKRPILLVHGWSNDADYIEKNNEDEWGKLEDELKAQGFEVWRLQYSPANLSNKENAGMIADAIQRLLSYGYKDYNSGKIDVISHSMGGLTVRGYIQNLGKDSNGNPVAYNNNIRKYVIIASPMGGSFFANIIDGITDINIANQHPLCSNFIQNQKLQGGSNASKDMEIGSDFTWDLNTGNLNSNVDYLTISGKKILNEVDTIVSPSYKYCLSNGWETNDGVVSLYSSTIVDKNYASILINRFHSPIFGGLLEEGVSNEQRAGKIIALFLKGNLNSNTVSQYIGNGEYYYDPDDSPTLPFQLDSGGGIVIQLKKSEVSVNNLSIRPTYSSSGYLLKKNNLTGRYYYSSINSVTNTALLFTNTLPSQNYIPVINGKDSSDVFFLKGGVPNMIELKFDKDNDNYDLQQIGGSDCDDNNPQIKPSAQERCNNLDDNCNLQIDEGFSKGANCSLGIGECASEGIMICSVDGASSVCNAIIKNPNLETCDNKDNDCDGLIDEENVCNQTNFTNQGLSLNNPTVGTYNERSIMFNLSSQDKFTKLVYSDNSGRDSSLCTNCYGYTRKKTLSDGNHTLLFKGILSDGKTITNQTSLFIDSKDPQISITKPQSRRFTNGSDFYIKYTEDNCKSLSLTINGNQGGFGGGSPCDSGRNVEKFISQNISSFDGQEVEYQFIITDIAGNKDESRLTRIKVDTTAPQIVQFTNWTIGNYAYFNMTINELNFNKVEYIDSYDGTRARWRSMCTSLKNNVCYKKINFRDGSHSLNIRITDDAGNAVYRSVSFTAV